MKMGKKVISAMAVLTLVLSISACSNKAVTPEEAFRNLSKATQGKMAIQMKMTGTEAQMQAADISLNYVFGKSKDSKKSGVSLSAQANIKSNNDKPVILEGRMNFDFDISTPAALVLNFEAGASADTISQFGAGLTGAMVVTANLDDLRKLSGVSDEEFKTQLDKFYKAMAGDSDSSGTSAKSEEFVSLVLNKVTGAVEKAEIKPTENGDKTVKVGSEEFAGKEYEYTITPANMKTILNSVADSAPEIVASLKALIAANETDKGTTPNQLDNFNVSTSDITEFKKSIDQLNITDNLIVKVLINSDGVPACIKLTFSTPIDKEKVSLEIAIGMKDIKTSEDGMAYYNKNKIEMYKDATVIPIENLMGMLNK